MQQPVKADQKEQDLKQDTSAAAGHGNTTVSATMGIGQFGQLCNILHNKPATVLLQTGVQRFFFRL